MLTIKFFYYKANFFDQGNIVSQKTLDLINVYKSFSQDMYHVTILKNALFSFNSLYSYAIMAPSGTGKSTMLHMLAGIDTPTSGSITYQDPSIDDSNQAHVTTMRQRLKIATGVVMQQPYLIQELTVLENVMLQAIANNTVTHTDTQKALELLSEVNLAHMAHAMPATLSGGQQQTIAILRSILRTPSFLLADEPTGNLDEKSAQRIITLLQQYQKKYAMGLIICTHDIKIAQQCDSIVNLKNYTLSIKE